MELVTILNLVRKQLSFIIITESWLTEEFNLVLETVGYKSHTTSRVGRTRGIKLFHLEYIATEGINNFFILEYSRECFFVKTAVPGSGNSFVPGFYRAPNKSLADCTQFIKGALE